MVEPVTAAAAIGAGASGLNNLLNIGASAYFSGKSYKRAVSLWKMQADWQERMANTAHQREVADLRKAGLNPILSATGGSGAPTGSVGMPTADTFNPDIDESALTSALAIRQQKNQNKMTDSQIDLNEKEGHVKDSQWSINQELEKNAYQEGLNLIDQGEILKNTAKKVKADADYQELVNKYYPQYVQAQINNLVTGSESNSASASYSRRRSPGYSYSINTPVGGVSYSGDNIVPKMPTTSAKSHIQYETIRGRKVPVRVFD